MITDIIGNKPTVTFGLQRHRYDEGEVVGPMLARNVSDGMYMIGGERFPMLIVEFNKYNAHLPPWSQVSEMYLTDGEAEVFAFITAHIDTLLSGKLKSVQLALSSAFEGRRSGDIIHSDDVLQQSSTDNSFKIEGTLE